MPLNPYKLPVFEQIHLIQSVFIDYKIFLTRLTSREYPNLF